MTTAPVRMDPRIRERRAEVQRAAGRRRLRVLMVATGVLVAAGLGYLIVTSPLLDVDAIKITGTRRMTPDAIRAASGVHTSEALLLVDTGAVAARLERLPYVEHAEVHRDLPGTLRVVVTEYQPTSFVRVPGAVMLVAPNGRVIARDTAAPPGAFQIRGVRGEPKVGELLSPPEAANVVPQLPPALAQLVRAVDVSEPSIALQLDQGAIRLGSLERLDAKAAAALAVLEQMHGESFAYIDVSTPSTPVARR